MTDRRFLYTLKIGMIEGGATLSEKFEIAKGAGFDGVELDSPGPYSADDVSAAVRDTGLVVPGVVDSVHWSKPLSHPDGAVRAEGSAALAHAIRDCHVFGGSTVLLVPAVVSASVSYRAAWERSMAELRAAVPLAQERGVRIAIENVWNEFLVSPVDAAMYVDHANTPTTGLPGERTVGWYFDIGNIWRLGHPAHWIEILGDRILKLDIKGYSRAKMNAEGPWKGFGVEIDEGDLDWASVRAALDDIGWRGWAAAEVRGGDAARLADIRRRMGRVLEG